MDSTATQQKEAMSSKVGSASEELKNSRYENIFTRRPREDEEEEIKSQGYSQLEGTYSGKRK